MDFLLRILALPAGLLTGLLFLGLALKIFTDLRDSFLSKHWPVVSGKVTGHLIDEPKAADDSELYFAKIRYTFDLEGTKYESDDLFWGQELFNFSYVGWPQRLFDYLGKFPQGKNIEVHYNPKNPKQSILIPGYTWQFGVWLLVLCGAGVLCLAITQACFQKTF